MKLASNKEFQIIARSMRKNLATVFLRIPGPIGGSVGETFPRVPPLLSLENFLRD